MRLQGNPGRSIEVENGAGSSVLAERVSPFTVRLELTQRRQPGSRLIELDHQEGMALLQGLAGLYDCEVVER